MILWMQGCGADPDYNESPGACPIDCSTAKIAGSGMKITPFQKKIEISCHALIEQNYVGSVPIKFKVEKNSRILPAETIPGAQAGGAEEPMKPIADASDAAAAAGGGGGGAAQSRTISVGGISFEPMVVAGHPPVLPNPDDKRFKYNGIITTSDMWCTDACGVGSIDFVPMCKTAPNKTVLSLHSGQMATTVEVMVNP